MECPLCIKLETKIKSALEQLMLLLQRKDLGFKHLASVVKVMKELEK